MRVVIAFILVVSPVFGQGKVTSTFYRDICFQKYENGIPVQVHVRRSRFVYDDRGRLVELVYYKNAGIKGISDKDVRDFGSGRKVRQRPGVEMFSQDYWREEFHVDVEVTDVLDDDLFQRQFKVLTKERTLRCLSY